MKKLWIYILISWTLIVLTNCNKNEENKGLRVNETLIVTLYIADDIDVNQIILTSTGGTDKILGSQINDKRKIKLKTPQLGEGVYSICIYTATDTLCSQDNYIESGYRPKLRLKNNIIETLEWF